MNQPTINYSVFPAPNLPQNCGTGRRRRRNRNKKKLAMKKKSERKSLLAYREAFFLTWVLSPFIGAAMCGVYAYLFQISVTSLQHSLEVFKGAIN